MHQKIGVGTVNRLARRIEKAIDRRDLEEFKRLFSQTIDIASGTPDDPAPTLRMEPRAALAVVMGDGCHKQTSITADASAAAFRWLAAHDGGLINDTVRQHFLHHQEDVVDIVKSVRRSAQSSTASPKARREAEKALARFGFDDESLRGEDADRD